VDKCNYIFGAISVGVSSGSRPGTWKSLLFSLPVIVKCRKLSPAIKREIYISAATERKK